MVWETKSIGEVCSVFTDGDWVETKDQSRRGVRLVQTGNVGQGEFKDRREKARFVSVETFDRLRCTELKANDCLISRLPDPVGRSCLVPDVDERLITAVDCTIARFNSDVVEPQFFVYYSQTRQYLRAVESVTSGSTRKRISRKNLGLLRFPFPPLEEQKRIVKILDAAFDNIDRAIANTHQSSELANALFRKGISTAFEGASSSWPRSRFADVIDSALIGLVRNKLAQDPGYPFGYVKMNNIANDNTYLGAGLARVDASADEVAKYRLRQGDFLFNTRNSHELVGKSCIYRGDPMVADVFNNNIMRLRFKPVATSQFVAFAFQSNAVSHQLAAMVSGTTSVAGIYFKNLKNLVIPLPDLETQRDVIKFLSGLRAESAAVCAQYADKEKHLLDLRQSLLHQAFSGQL